MDTIAEPVGTHTVKVRLTSPVGSSEEYEFGLTASQTIHNSAPQIQSQPESLIAVVDQLYAYDMTVTDADHDTLSYELVTAPAGMSLDPQNGTLRWLPGIGQLGQHKVSVSVTDPRGGSTIQSFRVDDPTFERATNHSVSSTDTGGSG